MSSPITTLPITDALGRALRDRFIAFAAPGINADLTAMMVTAQGESVDVVPQFSTTNVRVGDIDPVSETTLCIFPGITEGEMYRPSGGALYEYTSTLVLKIPAVGDNAPEDCMIVGNSVRDHVRDVFTSPAQDVMTPLNTAGQNILPTGLSFVECRYRGCIGPITIASPNNPGQRYRKWEMTHYCRIGYYTDRAQPLGG